MKGVMFLMVFAVKLLFALGAVFGTQHQAIARDSSDPYFNPDHGLSHFIRGIIDSTPIIERYELYNLNKWNTAIRAANAIEASSKKEKNEGLARISINDSRSMDGSFKDNSHQREMGRRLLASSDAKRREANEIRDAISEVKNAISNLREDDVLTGFQQWTNASGDQHINARIIAYHGEEVLLHREDGGIFIARLGFFSDEDGKKIKLESFLKQSLITNSRVIDSLFQEYNNLMLREAIDIEITSTGGSVEASLVSLDDKSAILSTDGISFYSFSISCLSSDTRSKLTAVVDERNRLEAERVLAKRQAEEKLFTSVDVSMNGFNAKLFDLYDMSQVIDHHGLLGFLMSKWSREWVMNEEISASQKNEVRRIYASGLINYFGLGDKVNVDYEKAFNLFLVAANAGHFRANSMLSYMVFRGHGVESEPERALNLAEASLNANSCPMAQFVVGASYVNSKEKEVQLKGLGLLRSAAWQGFADAEFFMATGALDVEKGEFALFWLARAVKNTHALALEYLDGYNSTLDAVDVLDFTSMAFNYPGEPRFLSSKDGHSIKIDTDAFNLVKQRSPDDSTIYYGRLNVRNGDPNHLHYVQFVDRDEPPSVIERSEFKMLYLRKTSGVKREPVDLSGLSVKDRIDVTISDDSLYSYATTYTKIDTGTLHQLRTTIKFVVGGRLVTAYFMSFGHDGGAPTESLSREYCEHLVRSVIAWN